MQQRNRPDSAFCQPVIPALVFGRNHPERHFGRQQLK